MYMHVVVVNNRGTAVAELYIRILLAANFITSDPEDKLRRLNNFRRFDVSFYTVYILKYINASYSFMSIFGTFFQ